jgi:hypothetical protein
MKFPWKKKNYSLEDAQAHTHTNRRSEEENKFKLPWKWINLKKKMMGLWWGVEYEKEIFFLVLLFTKRSESNEGERRIFFLIN